SFFGKLVEQKEEGGKQIYIFEDGDGNRYAFTLDTNNPETWVIDDKEGPLTGEMWDKQYYGEEGVGQKGFELYLNDAKKIVFEIKNPERVNLGILKGMAEVDPVYLVTF